MTSAPATTCYAANSAITEEDATHYPVEFLNSVEVTGLPSHLTSKLMWNICHGASFSESTQADEWNQMHFTRTKPNAIEVQISCGPYKQEKH